MIAEHRARITWSPACLARGLPDVTETIDPAWPPGVAPGTSEGWSLACRFAHSPREQGSPSEARVRFWMDEAPHDLLVPGARLLLRERGTGQYATVEILD